MEWHRLSGKIAGAAATGALLLAAGFALAGWMPGLLVPALALGVGALSYAAARRFLEVPLDHAHSALRQIHHQDFDALSANRQLPHDELGALLRRVDRTGQALEEEIEKLKRLENYRREYIGNVSHELKTPIFTIQGSAETLLSGALDDPDANRSFVEKIHRNAGRLDNLARDLSEISQIETGELQMSAEPFDVGELASDVLEAVESVAERKEITLRARLPDDLPCARGDRDRLRQVLTNLADNAIKYNSAGGFVEIVARLLPSDEIKLSVVDDGIGVDPDHVPRLTERFYRVDKSRSRSQGGTGLGLAIVKHILSAHDRTLQVESTPDQGSTFSFTLPLAEEAARRPFS
jgi:two-component system phosphate regulon sensor histidine kinase PhoR